MSTSKEPLVSYPTRLGREQLDQLRQLAKLDDRTLAWEVRQAISAYLHRRSKSLDR